MFGITDGFDIVIGNPPYIKENVFKSAFNGVRNQECYQGKMDIWYLFGAKALDVLTKNGVLCFIATNNWVSNDGASKFRNKINNEAIIYSYVDFGNFKIFSAGIQTMVFVILKNNQPSSYITNYSKVINESINYDDLVSMLSSNDECTNSEYIKYRFRYNRQLFVNVYISFSNNETEEVIDKITKSSEKTLCTNEIFSGIDIMQDFVTKNHIGYIDSNKKIGDGIFVLSKTEYENIQWEKEELEIIKPYYTTKEINKYHSNINNNYWILYTSAKVNQERNRYQNIKKHLDQFRNVITSVNKPYGLHRTRNENIFLGEKILSIRKCATPSFAYVDFPCYVARTFLVIKTNRFNLKYLTTVLNSKLVKFYLKNKGKLQGNNYQIDKKPLMLIPIKYDIQSLSTFITIYNFILLSEYNNSQKNFFESLIDTMVYELYFPEEIKSTGAEILKHLTDLPELKDDWSDEKKLEIIEKVYKELSDPKHPASIAMEKQKMVPEVRIIEGLPALNEIEGDR